jgi:hypothetical protein
MPTLGVVGSREKGKGIREWRPRDLTAANGRRPLAVWCGLRPATGRQLPSTAAQPSGTAIEQFASWTTQLSQPHPQGGEPTTPNPQPTK